MMRTMIINTPMIKTLMSEKTPPTTETDSVQALAAEEEPE